MGNPNADKGAKWERDVRDYLREWFGRRDVVRPRQEGFGDVGDIHISPFIIQAKDVTSASLGAWMDAAEAQAVRAGESFAAVAWKRRRHARAAGFVTMNLKSFRELVWRLRAAENLLSDHPEHWTAYLIELRAMRENQRA